MNCPDCYDDNYTYIRLEETGTFLFNCPRCGRAYTLRRAKDEDDKVITEDG